jgi:hypothetical protein
MSTLRENISEIKAQPSSVLVNRVRDSFGCALAGESQLDSRILSIEGMSGKKYRHFINNLVRSLGDTRYLEVGTWAGSTLCSAINRNIVRATAVDNWSQFDGPKARFLENLAAFRTPRAYVNLIEDDFRNIDFASIGKFDIYLFDGPHEYQDQHDGLELVLPALESTFVFIVDDWNWEQVRRGTLDAVAKVGTCLEYALEIRTTFDGSQPEIRAQYSDWHNGYFISVLSKRQ